MNELYSLISKSLKLGSQPVTQDMCMANTTKWDSLAHMDLILAIEEKYGLQLDGDEIAELVSVPAIEALLSRKGIQLS